MTLWRSTDSPTAVAGASAPEPSTLRVPPAVGEPEHLRRLRERVESLEAQRDFALSRYIEAQARYANQQAVWAAE